LTFNRRQRWPQLPIPVQPGEIDFGKILFLIKDQLITSIECPGVNKNVIIKKAGNIIKTQIVLEKEEIMAIIKTFSDKAKIPLVEGMLIARIDNLEISAVVPTSASTSPSFIIKKEPVTIQIRPISQLMKPMMQTTPTQIPRQMPFIPSQTQFPPKPAPINPTTPTNLPNK
jgi:type IV secretory pathway ATPase VirB11/archaellum biosynthesis ATPase